MWKHTTAGLLAVAVLAMVLFAGCRKPEKSEKTQQQGQVPSATPMPGQVSGQVPTAPAMPGFYGSQEGPSAPAQPTEPVDAALSGSSYKERYKQGNLTAEELRQEYKLQKVERELGYPVGP